MFKRIAKRNGAKFQLEERIPITDLLRADYTKRSGLADAFFCMLARRHPRYIKTDSEIPQIEYSSRANRKDKHHIFPRKLLEKHEFGRRDFNSICNICFIVAEENQSFGKNPPSNYLNNFRRRRYFGKAMRSHLIPYKSASPIWHPNIKSGYKSFRKERLFLIAKEFELLAGINLFRKD